MTKQFETRQKKVLDALLKYAKDNNIEVETVEVRWNKEVHDDVTRFLKKLKEFGEDSRKRNIRSRYHTPAINYS